MPEESQVQLMTELYRADEKDIKKVCEKLKVSTEGIKSKFCLINRIAEELQKELTKVSDDDKPKFLHDLLELVADIPPPLEKTAASKVKKEEKVKEEGVLVDTTSVLRRQFKIIGQIGVAEQKDKLTYNSLTKKVRFGVKLFKDDKDTIGNDVITVTMDIKRTTTPQKSSNT
ncbi:hypothetical protein AC249_AIPGENE8642 [Exaiptasia diaphana]|nr:hypothetical protein AC249_AIPGENE8642 [Exaiptasia diaphana]